MKAKTILMLGDAVLIFLFMVVGLQFHDSGGARFLPNFVPFAFAWWLAGHFTNQWATPTWRSLWSVLPAAALAAPLGAVLRAAWLGGIALPLFTGITAAGLSLLFILWRMLYILVLAKRVS